MNRYFIKEGYSENIVDGKPAKVYQQAPAGTKYQISVFKFIRNYIKKNISEIKSIIDLGCGSAYKLNRYLAQFNIPITGVDQDFSVKAGVKQYPKIKWVEDDFSTLNKAKLGKHDIIISSDVIEHLVEPKNLLERIKQCAHIDSIIFISTPERDLVRGEKSFGPPENIKHVREWNQVELSNYLCSEGFTILKHLILPAKKLSWSERVKTLLGLSDNNTCQLVVCKYNG